MSAFHLKTIVLTAVCGLTFSACSVSPSQNLSPATPLQQVQNIDALPDTKTNSATLSKAKDHCVIQFTGYFDGGESAETWTFQAQKLQQAYSETYKYNQQDTVDAIAPKTALDLNSKVKTVFDIQSPETKNNFEKLKSYFNKDALNQCA
jgi:hypothetical protein